MVTEEEERKETTTPITDANGVVISIEEQPIIKVRPQRIIKVKKSKIVPRANNASTKLY